MKILIVDDEPHYREIIRTVLSTPEFEKHEIIQSNSGTELLETLGITGGGEEVDDVGVILMDVTMPDITGIEATKKIKSKKTYKDVPIIMVTANSDPELLNSAFDAGAMDYIEKPCKNIEFVARVHSALRLKKECDKRSSREKKLAILAKDFERANWKLKRLAYLDGMTGVSNRRYFDEYLERSWKNGMREKKPLSLVLIDVDSFRPFNDRYSILAGDDCLIKIAEALDKVATRPNDLTARYAGEKFSFILPDTPMEPAINLAEKARKAVEDLNIPHSLSKVSKFVTVSIGVATAIPAVDSHYKIFKEADKVLFNAKQAGRNRVESFDISTSSE